MFGVQSFCARIQLGIVHYSSTLAVPSNGFVSNKDKSQARSSVPIKCKRRKQVVLSKKTFQQEGKKETRRNFMKRDLTGTEKTCNSFLKTGMSFATTASGIAALAKRKNQNCCKVLHKPWNHFIVALL